MRRSVRLCVTVLAVALTAVSTPVGASSVAADPMLGAPTVGPCFDHDYAEVSEETAPSAGPVDCSLRHTAINVAVVPLPDGLPLTGDTDKTFDYLGDQCRSEYETAIGVPHKLWHIASFGRSLYLPPQDLVEQGARWGRCDVVTIVGKTVVPIGPSTPLITSKPQGDTMRCLRKDYSATTCSRAHAWAPNAILTLRGPSYPSRAAQIRFGQRRCDALDGARHHSIFWVITRTAWKHGERHMVCWKNR